MDSNHSINLPVILGPCTLYHGDALEVLRTLPDDSVHCCVTSPPYLGLRDYGVEGQMGLEKTPEEYVAKMVKVFREVRRVLRGDGTCWLNMGDAYSSGDRTTYRSGASDNKGQLIQNDMTRPKTPPGLKPKDLIGIPWRLAFALQAPYETHLITDRSDRAWLAAMIDGEGCITIPECKSGHDSGSSFPPIIQIRMCDKECLQKCIELTGNGGNLTEQLPPSYLEANQRPNYQWRINGTTVAAVLADIYPFLLIKRKQACVAWTLQNVRDSYETKRGSPIPDVALGKQQECRRIISKLNQREPVDLPTWIEEPKFIVEPGWYLRQDCIWHKPNPMPESVTDRCTKSHEYIFLLTKSARYFFDSEAVKEPGVIPAGTLAAKGSVERFNTPGVNSRPPEYKEYNGTRNKRSVWTVPSAPYSEAHFATFPPDLIKPCILAGTSARGCCPECGAPWERIIEKEPNPMGITGGEHREVNRNGGLGKRERDPDREKRIGQSQTTGWEPGCDCRLNDAEPCTVLDPFAGSGTTGMVAAELGRQAILIELNPKYLSLAQKRCDVTPGLALA